MLSLVGDELHGFTEAKPKRLCRKIIETGGTVRVTEDHIHVHFHKRAHNPILRQAALDTKAGGNPLGRRQDPALHLRRYGMTTPKKC